MMTICPSCGSTSNPVGATTCRVCGASLSPGSSLGSAKPALTVQGSRRKYNLSTSVPTLVGSRGCAVLLSAPGVAAQHARLTPSGGGFLIEPMMGAVTVNGSSISTATSLQDGAAIQIGGITLTYSGPAIVPPPLPGIAPTLSPPSPSLPGFTPGLSPVKLPSPSAPKRPLGNPLQSFLARFRSGPPLLEGSVLVLDGPHSEGPDIDWAGLILRSTFGLVLLPFLCWQPALITPFFLYGMSQRNRQAPARYLRVQDKAGKQFVVKMKGEPVRGMLSQGDGASFWGRWDGGNLVMDRAWNHATHSDVLLKPAVQRKRNRTILLIIVGIILLYLVFMAGFLR